MCLLLMIPLAPSNSYGQALQQTAWSEPADRCRATSIQSGSKSGRLKFRWPFLGRELPVRVPRHYFAQAPAPLACSQPLTGEVSAERIRGVAGPPIIVRAFRYTMLNLKCALGAVKLAELPGVPRGQVQRTALQRRLSPRPGALRVQAPRGDILQCVAAGKLRFYNQQ